MTEKNGSDYIDTPESEKGNTIKTSLNKGKALLEKAKGRKAKKERREFSEDKPSIEKDQELGARESPTSSATAMLTKVKKAAGATRSSVNKMVPHKKPSFASEKGSAHLVMEDVRTKKAANVDGAVNAPAMFAADQRKVDSIERKSSNLSEEFAKRIAPVINFSKNIAHKRRSDTGSETQETDTVESRGEVAESTKVEPKSELETFSVAIPENESLAYTRGDSVFSWSSQSTSSPRRRRIEVGPFLSFLLRDSSIVVGTSLVVAAVPTILFWDSIVQNQIPFPVSFAWMVFSFLFGRELERVHGSGKVLPDVITVETDSLTKEATQQAVTKVSSKHSEDQPEEHYTIFMKATKNFNNLKFRLAGQKSVKKPRKKFWTNLSRSRDLHKTHWEKNIQAPKTRALLTKLYRDPSLRRMSITQEVDEVLVDDAQEIKDSAVGTFDLSNCTADTLADCVVEPLFRLRGMDVFLTGEDGADDSLGDHPFLIEGGLRRKKTLLVNIMLQWANVLIYFEMPNWVESLDGLVEKEDDSDDVKALKRFINGNDEYRNQRLKIIPSLVDGPRIIKMLSPPKKELTICRATLPVTWNKSNGKTESDGSKHQPLLEVELDCMANKTMRGMANIVKRNLSGVVIDLAAIIQKPDGAEEDEPSACLGMWRFDRVDIDTCPMLPERKIKEEEVIRRASALVGLSPEEMAELEDEV